MKNQLTYTSVFFIHYSTGSLCQFYVSKAFEKIGHTNKRQFRIGLTIRGWRWWTKTNCSLFILPTPNYYLSFFLFYSHLIYLLLLLAVLLALSFMRPAYEKLHPFPIYFHKIYCYANEPTSAWMRNMVGIYKRWCGQMQQKINRQYQQWEHKPAPNIWERLHSPERAFDFFFSFAIFIGLFARYFWIEFNLVFVADSCGDTQRHFRIIHKSN